MSERPIGDKTNRPSPEKADCLKSPLLEPPAAPPIEPFPTFDPDYGPPEGFQLSPDYEATASLSSAASGGPQCHDAVNNLSQQDELLAQPRQDTVQAGGILASRERNATVDIREPGISSSARNRIFPHNDTPSTPARGNGATPLSVHGADLLPSREPSPRPLSRRASESSSSTGRSGVWTRPRSYEVVPVSTVHLPPTLTEDMESNSMAPYTPTAGTLPPDENVPLSPGGAAESPPGESHTFAYLFPPLGPGPPRAITSGHGPNHPGLTEPLPPRFQSRGNSMSRFGADMQHEMEEGRIRTTIGNALATQTASRAGVVQRDFTPLSERPERSRAPSAIDMPFTVDPEEADMVDPGEVFEMQERQEERYDEFWTSPAFQLLIDKWMRNAP